MPQPGAFSAESLIALVYVAVPDEGVQGLLLAFDELLRVEGENLFGKETTTHLLDLDLMLFRQVRDCCHQLRDRCVNNEGVKTEEEVCQSK
jgi:hypothetical protein